MGVDAVVVLTTNERTRRDCARRSALTPCGPITLALAVTLYHRKKDHRLWV
jgi:hypothetical protein